MGGENTAATIYFKSVEHVVKVTAKRRLFLVTSVTPRPVTGLSVSRILGKNRNYLLAAGFTYKQRRNNKNEGTKKRKK